MFYFLSFQRYKPAHIASDPILKTRFPPYHDTEILLMKIQVINSIEDKKALDNILRPIPVQLITR